MDSGLILSKFQKLPIDIQNQLSDYIEFLIKKYSIKNRKKDNKDKFQFDWESGLSDLKQISSVELQHKVSQWR